MKNRKQIIQDITVLLVAVLFGFGMSWLAAHAQTTVTASVSCNETNRLYSTTCMDWNGQNVSGEIMGTQFYTIWINPELMLFWTPTAYWFVTPNGIEYE
jgi:hypothetical protein